MKLQAQTFHFQVPLCPSFIHCYDAHESIGYVVDQSWKKPIFLTLVAQNLKPKPKNLALLLEWSEFNLPQYKCYY